MQVHEIERNSTLQIPVDFADHHLAAYIDNLQVTEMGFGDGFVNSFVLLYAADEIALGVLTRHIFVVRIARGDLQGDIGSDNGRIVTHRFEEYQYQARLPCNTLLNLGPA